MMVLRRTSYPQVDPRAAGLLTRAIAVVPDRLPAGPAAALGRRRGARLVVARIGVGWGGVTAETLAHAVRLGLGDAPVRALLWSAPQVAAEDPEIVIRRRLGPGTPFVLVRGRGGPLGAVLADRGASRALPLFLTEKLARLPPPVTRVLRLAGQMGDECGWPVVAVGGLVRDIVVGGVGGRRQPCFDLDLTVEGDAGVLARRLADALGGELRMHPTFLTASLTLGDGQRVDVATARRERYRTPGALPDVQPASLVDDLWRRDFSLNALAVRLNPRGWGELVDPTGGLRDARARRIRVLHPLSFIEDPTRVFRAGRYAVRLGCRLEPSTARLLAEATRRGGDTTLSGDRLRAELRLAAGESAPVEVLHWLGERGAFRLVWSGYRFSRTTRPLLARVARGTGPLRIGVEARDDLYVLALTAGLAPGAADTWTRGLGLSKGQVAALARTRADAPALARELAGVADAGEAEARLRRVTDLTAAWAWVQARGPRVRQAVARYFGCWRQMRPLLAGDDLLALGARPGPGVGAVLAAARTEQVAGRLRNRAEALRWARIAAARLRSRVVDSPHRNDN